MSDLRSLPKKKILVVAPHADDEVIGCGGTISVAADSGAEVTLVVMAVGGVKHHHLENAATTDNRMAELQHASKELGIQRSMVLFSGQDMRLEEVGMLMMVSALDDVLNNDEYDECYLPTPSHNLDHRLTHDAAITSLRPCGRRPMRLVALYESTVVPWESPAGAGGRIYVDIESSLHRKIAALHAYKSQVRSYPHPVSEEAIRRLAAMRGLECGLGYAERFALLRMVRT